jgi:hypothetical protein
VSSILLSKGNNLIVIGGKWTRQQMNSPSQGNKHNLIHTININSVTTNIGIKRNGTNRVSWWNVTNSASKAHRTNHNRLPSSQLPQWKKNEHDRILLKPIRVQFCSTSAMLYETLRTHRTRKIVFVSVTRRYYLHMVWPTCIIHYPVCTITTA